MEVKVLVDTGPKIPIAFRRKLIPGRSLKTASFPVQFTMADGKPMIGGTHGTMMQFQLPTYRGDDPVLAKTTPLFAYEADIQGCDVILGYPFLKAFHLVVDTVRDGLCLQDNHGVIPSSTRAEVASSASTLLSGSDFHVQETAPVSQIESPA